MNKQMLKELDRLEHAICDGDPQRLRQAVDDLRDATKVLSSANETQVGDLAPVWAAWLGRRFCFVGFRGHALLSFMFWIRASFMASLRSSLSCSVAACWSWSLV